LRKTFNFQTSTKAFDLFYKKVGMRKEMGFALDHNMLYLFEFPIHFAKQNKTKQNKPNLVLNIVRFWRDIGVYSSSLSLWDLASGNENSRHIFLFAFGDGLSVQFF